MRTKQTKVSETHGSCRLSAFDGMTISEALDKNNASLVIRPERGASSAYDVQRLYDDDGCVIGFRLTKRTQFIVDRKVYDIDVTRGYERQCDCPSAEYSGKTCKHVRALQQALARCGQLPQKPVMQSNEDCGLDDL